jgi:hypothetical protein
MVKYSEQNAPGLNAQMKRRAGSRGVHTRVNPQTQTQSVSVGVEGNLGVMQACEKRWSRPVLPRHQSDSRQEGEGRCWGLSQEGGKRKRVAHFSSLFNRTEYVPHDNLENAWGTVDFVQVAVDTNASRRYSNVEKGLDLPRRQQPRIRRSHPIRARKPERRN